MAPWPYNEREYLRARRDVLAGDPMCWICRRRRADTVDHHPITVVMVKRRGLDPAVLWDPANLRPACRSCNSRRGALVGNASPRRRREGGSRAW